MKRAAWLSERFQKSGEGGGSWFEGYNWGDEEVENSSNEIIHLLRNHPIKMNESNKHPTRQRENKGKRPEARVPFWVIFAFQQERVLFSFFFFSLLNDECTITLSKQRLFPTALYFQSCPTSTRKTLKNHLSHLLFTQKIDSLGCIQNSVSVLHGWSCQTLLVTD